jgi:branched-chain amino acid transport system ATP-binding protein
VTRGQRHALIGPNGAGKSTLFNLISGHYVPDAGQILLNGRSIVGQTPHAINRLGLSRSFQITNLFPRMSVAENLRISVMGQHGHRFALFRRVAGLARVAAEVDEYLEKLRHLPPRRSLRSRAPAAHARDRHGARHEPEILLPDEPTGGVGRSPRARRGSSSSTT